MQAQQEAQASNPLINTLLADYNRYRLVTADVCARRSRGEYVRSLTPTGKSGAELCKAFVKMIEFCDKRGFDSRLWLYSIFKSWGWSRAPRPNQLCSEGHVPKYQRVGREAQPMLTQQVNVQLAQMREEAGTEYDPNRDITPGAEALKGRLAMLGDHERCMNLMKQTMGFHPKSRVCSACPIASACATKLAATATFDILALRRGEITAHQAQNVARSRSHAAG